MNCKLHCIQRTEPTADAVPSLEAFRLPGPHSVVRDWSQNWPFDARFHVRLIEVCAEIQGQFVGIVVRINRVFASQLNCAPNKFGRLSLCARDFQANKNKFVRTPFLSRSHAWRGHGRSAADTRSKGDCRNEEKRMSSQRLRRTCTP